MALFKKSGFDFEEYYKEQEREEKKRNESLNNILNKKPRDNANNQQTLQTETLTKEQFAAGELQYEEQIQAYFRPKENYAVKMAALAPLVFILFWCIIDLGALIGLISGVIAGSIPAYILGFIIPFFAVHMTPVWLWIASIVKTKKSQKYKYYVVTDRRIIVTRRHYKTDTLAAENNVKFNETLAIALSQTDKQKQNQIGTIYVFGKKGMLQLDYLQNPEQAMQQIETLINGDKNKIEFIYDTSVDLNSYIQRSKYYWMYNNEESESEDEIKDDAEDEKEWDDDPDALLAKDQEELEIGDWDDEEIDEDVDHENYNLDEVSDRLINNPSVTEENRQLLIEQKQRSAEMRAKLKQLDESIAKAKNKEYSNQAAQKSGTSLVDLFTDINRRADEGIKKAQQLKRDLKNRRNKL